MWAANELREVACDGCGGTRTAVVCQRPDGLTAVECEDCRLCFLSPRPVDEAIGKLYDESYFQKAGGGGVGYSTYLSASTRELNEQAALRRLSLIGEQAGVRGARLLEIGCATGEFAAAAARKGASVIGVDLSREAIEEGRRRHPGLDLRAGDVFEAVSDQQFDLICGFEVIEHVTSPTAFLRRLRALLRPGGMLVLTTPNYACAKRLGSEPWLGFHSSYEHLYFFAPETLRAIGSRTGFSFVTWYSVGTGRVPSGSEPRWKSVLRPIVQRTRVLDLARRARLRFVPGGHEYVREGEGHNLFAFLRAS